LLCSAPVELLLVLMYVQCTSRKLGMGIHSTTQP
jgi:hypothetical protein